MRVFKGQGVPGRLLSLLLSVALVLPVAMALGVVAAPPAAAAVLTLTKTAPEQALVGDPVRYELVARNADDPPLYNVTFRDVLPVGMTYVAGSSTSAAGEPQVITNGVVPNQVQTLIWSNVADLQPTSTFTLTFQAVPDPTRLPVGTPVQNTGFAYGDEDPRTVADFNPDGSFVAGSASTGEITSGPRTTTFTAIEVRKSEPSPEDELLRGVHTQTTTYTLEVENNNGLPTTGVTVVDYLPASLEFLHCGGVDNSAQGFVEYPGAPRLTVVPPPSGAGDCPPIGRSVTPFIDSVDTVTLAANNPEGYPEGVYTRVSYVLGDMAKGQTITLKYRAGIPLKQNVAFPAGTATTGVQAANLDNNTGPSTRETDAESSVTNRVVVQGVYTGPIVTNPIGPVVDPDGGLVSATDKVTRTIEDLAMVKSVDKTEFAQGQLATYTLTLRGSEYVTSSNVVVTDVLPNGVCPLYGEGFSAVAGGIGVLPDCRLDQAGASAFPPRVLTSPSQVPSLGRFSSYATVADGTTTIVFAPVAVAANGTTTITYDARMRTLYGGTSDGTSGLAGQPIAAGDSFTNEADLTGTTTPIPNSPETGTQSVVDDSQATLPSGGASLDKAIKPKDTTFADVYECDGPTAIPSGWTEGALPTPYGDTEAFLATTGFDRNRLAFRKGDRVCFQITARFAANTQTRNAVITDFLPDGTRYEPNSFSLVGPTGDPAQPTGENNLQASQVDFNEAEAVAGTQDPTWVLGAPFSGTPVNTLPQGAIFQARFSVIIERAADAQTVDIVGNLVKMRTENSAGQAQSYRDQEDFGIIPPPPLPTVKGVAQVNGVDQPTWDPDTGNDNVLVKQGDLVTYRIDVSNEGTIADANAVAARQYEIWDVLPTGITCADVVGTYTYEPAVAPGTIRVACYAPGATIPVDPPTPPVGTPPTINTTGRSVIQWKDTAQESAASNQNAIWAPSQLGTTAPAGSVSTRSFRYTVRIPAEVSVGTVLPNTAGVRQYGVLNNLLTGPPYFPAENIDPSIAAADFDAPRSRDDSSVRLGTVTTTKGVSSTINEPGNVGLETSPQPSTQAVPGEVVTYTVTASIPAQTTVYNATFSDPMPTGLTFLSADADWASTGSASGPWASLPDGVTLDTTTSSQAPTLRFPPTYNNATTTAQLFRMTIKARVLAIDTTNVQGVQRTNTATFSSTPALSGGTALTSSASSRVDVVEPAPSILKSTNAPLDGTVVGGQKVAFTLTVTNAAGRPPLHDSWVVDCVPTGLTNPKYTETTPAGLPTRPQEVGTGTTGNPGNGCPTGTTRLAWNTGLLQAGTPISLGYEVTVELSATGGQTYTNVATVSGNSLAGLRTDPTDPGNPDGRKYSATDDLTLTVIGAGSFKTVDKPNATIGEIVTYTIRAELPPNVNFYNVALIDSLPAGVAPEATGGRLTPVVSTQCVQLLPNTPPSTTTCTPDIVPTLLTPAPNPINPAAANTIGLGLGDLGPSTSVRQVTVTYTARVVDVVSSTTGKDLVNSVVVKWDLTNSADPTSVNRPGGWNQTSQPRTATVNVTQPSLTPTKTVSDSTVEPGQTWTYTVTVTNASGPDVSAAYDATITDAVPSGVVVVPASLTASGGVLTGTEPDGSGGTITWTVPGPIAAPGGSVTFTYSARLAPSPTINATPQVNTADVGAYYSLPKSYPPGFPDAPNGPRDRREYNGPTTTSTVSPLFPALTAVKTAPNGPIAYIDDEFAWRFEVTNSGGAGAFDVDLVDTLPPNWRFVPGSASVAFPGVPVSTTDPTLSLVGDVQTLTWTDRGDLAVGQTVIVDFRAKPLAAAVQPPPIGSAKAHTNSVQATADDATGASSNLTGPYQSNLATAVARIHAADVAIDKTAGDFVAGATGTFSLVVRNNGPDTAVGPFVVTDPLPATPAGLSYVSAAGSGWTCSLLPVTATPGTVRCVRTNAADTLASGALFAPIVITVAVDSNVPSATTYVNTAAVVAKTFDPNLANNSDPATATVRAEADLRVVKKLSGDLVAGRDATYTIDVDNLGPSVSRANIVVRDTLPPGAIFRSAGGVGWATCTLGTGVDAGVVTCTRTTDLPAREPAGQITLVVGIPSSQTVDVVNTARVSGATPETTLANNVSTVTTPVTREADLAIEKRHVGPFVAGKQGTYEFQVTNFGPSDAAASVRITDSLPAGLTYVSATSTAGNWGCSATGQDLTCTRGGATPTPMPNGADETLTVIVDIDPNLPIGPISNTATVSSPTKDPNLDNNTDPDETGTETLADLAIVKTVKDDPVTAGQTVTYTLAVTNLGPSVARQVITVTDVIPTGLSWAGPDSTPGTDWSCSYDDPTRKITCTRAVDLAAPLSPSDPPVAAPPITLVLGVDPDAGPATIVNSATVDSPTNDPDLSNNTDDVPVRVVDSAEISLSKMRVGTDPVTAGTNVEFIVTVTNEGPSDADNVIVVDTLEAGLVPVRATGDGWNCSVSGLTFTCTRPTATANADGSPKPAPPITVTAAVGPSVPDGTTLVNTATVRTSTPGDGVSNNTGTADVPVVAIADLVLKKSVQPLPDGETLDAGEQVTYDLLVTNEWKSDAVAPIKVIDTLPAGFTYAGTAGTGWECSAVPGSGSPATGDVVTCILGDGTTQDPLPAGATAPLLSLLVSIDPTVTEGTYTNDAVVSTPTTEVPKDNNRDSAPVDVGEQADLSIIKSHKGTARVGDELTFTLEVSNAGPSVARTVVVTDTLPKGLTFVSARGATGDDWSCSEAVSVVTCELAGVLNPRTTADLISLVVKVGPQAYPSVVNPAEVDSATFDPDRDNNKATDTVDLPALVDLAVTKSHTGTFQVGQRATYTVVVTNNGPTPAPGVVVTDTLPTGLTYVSATGAGVTCAAVGQVVTCTAVEPLGVDKSLTIALTVEVLPTAYPGVTNVVSVSSPSEETRTDNNTATDPAVVSPLVDLDIVKELVDQDGDRAVFEITVTNNGPSATSAPIVVVDDLPVGLQLVAAQGSGWQCGVTEPVTCTYAASLPVGGQASIGVVSTITAPAGATVTNVATVTAGCSPAPSGVQAASVRSSAVDCGSAEAELTVPPLDGDTEGAGDNNGDSGGLADTGATAGPLGLLALAMLVLGGAAVLSSRSRRQH